MSEKAAIFLESGFTKLIMRCKRFQRSDFYLLRDETCKAPSEDESLSRTSLRFIFTILQHLKSEKLLSKLFFSSRNSRAIKIYHPNKVPAAKSNFSRGSRSPRFRKQDNKT